MRHLFAEWKTLKETLKGKNIFIFTDYDGTLAPIAQTPAKAVIPAETKEILKASARQRGCTVAIISGRALKDIRSLVGLNNIIYAGNHGFELEGPKIKFRNAIPARYRKTIERIKSTLWDKLASVKGVLIEDKGLSLSLHYRRVDKKNIPLVKAIFHETVIIPRVKGQVKITFGKKVLEVRLPGEWNKGKVAIWLL
ncbi:MAG: trehalose-phosphatase, partial [Candidatus Omnitrophica bacterium]|nr:trehalose-phosphatase [Candidatus Omnitrophota bacterium]